MYARLDGGFIPPTINQSERDYSVRHGAYVRCFNQSEHDYSVRHGVYVRFSTNQSTGIAYVTGCTYAFRRIRARRSRILISVAPCGGLRRPAVPLRRPAVPLRRPAVPLRRPVEACGALRYPCGALKKGSKTSYYTTYVEKSFKDHLSFTCPL